MRSARPTLPRVTSRRTAPRRMALALCTALGATVLSNLPLPAGAVSMTEHCFSDMGLQLAAQTPVVTVVAVQLDALNESNLGSRGARLDLRARVLWSGHDAVPEVLGVAQFHPGRSLGAVGQASILLLGNEPDLAVWQVLDGFPARTGTPRAEAEACLVGLG